MEEMCKVTRDEYAGFLGQIIPSAREVEIQYLENCTITNIKSKKTGKLLCARVIYEEDPEQYYVYNMPDDDERQEPRPVRKIVLDSQEDVQNFFNILNKILANKK